MSIRVMSEVWQHSTHKGSALVILLAIADFADDDGNAYPSISALARKCRMSERNTRNCLSLLERSGELTITNGAGPKGENLYRVRVNPTLPLFRDGGVQSLQGVQPVVLTHVCSTDDVIRTPSTVITDTDVSRNEEARAQKSPRCSRTAGRKRPIPPDFGISDQVRAWAAKHGYDQLEVHLEAFKNKAYARGYLYVDWDRAFMEAIRANWANVKRMPKPDTSCRRLLPGGERCGMPGRPHPVYGYSCEHCDRKDEALASRNIPDDVRKRLNGLLARRNGQPEPAP